MNILFCSPWVSYVSLLALYHFIWTCAMFFSQCYQVGLLLTMKSVYSIPSFSSCSLVLKYPVVGKLASLPFNWLPFPFRILSTAHHTVVPWKICQKKNGLCANLFDWDNRLHSVVHKAMVSSATFLIGWSISSACRSCLRSRQTNAWTQTDISTSSRVIAASASLKLLIRKFHENFASLQRYDKVLRSNLMDNFYHRWTI